MLAEINARVAARRQDIRVVRGHLAIAEEAAAEQKRAEGVFNKADAEETEREGEGAKTAVLLKAARTKAAAEIEHVIARWTGSTDIPVLVPGNAAALATALQEVGEPEAPALREVFRALTDVRRTAAQRHLEDLQRQLQETRTTLEETRTKRTKVAEERDDAPPASDLRPADRSERPGAALWQLVRFADDVPVVEAAAVEGALYGAGLLTAWLHPHPDASLKAVRERESDGFLLPLPTDRRPTGQTLADVLLPEDQPHVPAEAISAVLASIALTDDVTTAGGTRDLGIPAVSAGAQYALGVQWGTHPKLEPEYIGATARAARRRARLEAFDQAIADLESALGLLVERRNTAAESVADFDVALGQLPSTGPIISAVRNVAIAAERLADARTRRSDARSDLDGAIAIAHDKHRQLRHAAAAVSLPVVRDDIALVEHAVADFATAGQELDHARTRIPDLERDLTDRRNAIATQREDCTEHAAALESRRSDHSALAERLRTQEATLGAPLRKIHEQIDAATTELAVAESAYETAEQTVGKQQTALTQADDALQYIREALSTALGEQLRTAAALEPYTRPDLLRLLDAGTDATWTPADLWPATEQVTQALMTQLTAAETDSAPLAAARSALPAGALALLDVLDEATRGRPATDTILKTTTTKISNALSDLEAALAASDQGYHLEWEPDGDIILARVSDNDGPAPVAEFARYLAEQLADQRVLLEDKERTVLEDGLLTGLAQQIHSRTLEARDLVIEMDADTRAKPMSSGTTVGIRWIQSDQLTDSQRAVNRLLQKDAAALGPAGLAELRSHLRGQIRAGQARDRRKTYQQVITDVLDYRAWRKFELLLSRPGEKEEKLTRAKHSEMSGGEKSASIHLPLFAAANAQYGSARPTCPRLIALDEAFAGIDEQYRPDLLALTVKFDLDLFMTGHDLWITYPGVPRIAHYDMNYDKASHTVSALLMLWDGDQIHDDLGFPGSDELAADVIGFTPSRHAPVHGGFLVDDPTEDTAPDDEDDAREDDGTDEEDA